MGIYIPNMEMPSFCCECPLKETVFFYDNNCIPQKKIIKVNFDTGKDEGCPLVVLPAGHGRLIDADALQEEFKKYHDGKRLLLIDTATTIVPAEGGEADEKPV